MFIRFDYIHLELYKEACFNLFTYRTCFIKPHLYLYLCVIYVLELYL